ncbi:PadR family transcriptional regulator [Streptomyces sp. 1-11]|uniref:PadR family transcriptional regulator n=1 Tax=Streptomyces sp. 1-11 TaxID=2590549 RepID=UPI001F3D8209|nr:helix-turn-helix transcriptional regulator [Streptomyces sp. 1-11]
MAVLEALFGSTPDAPAWGLSICRQADLGPGTVYPILDRLLERGWVRSWDEEDAHPGRPARRFYEFTGAGRHQAREALEARAARRARFSLRPTGGAA